MMNKKIFISHGSQDNEFVKNLGESLEIQDLETWVDFTRLKGGDELEPKIKKAIEQARAFIVVLSPNTFNSTWVLKEVDYAQEVKKKQKKPGDYPVIPLMLPGVGPGDLNKYFKEEPKGIQVQIGAGGINEAMPHILAALGERPGQGPINLFPRSKRKTRDRKPGFFLYRPVGAHRERGVKLVPGTLFHVAHRGF